MIRALQAVEVWFATTFHSKAAPKEIAESLTPG
jgi:hypothetical protein